MVDGTVWDVLYYDRGVYHMVVMWDGPSNSRLVGFDSGGATHDGFGRAVKSCLAGGGNVASHT